MALELEKVGALRRETQSFQENRLIWSIKLQNAIEIMTADRMWSAAGKAAGVSGLEFLKAVGSIMLE